MPVKFEKCCLEVKGGPGQRIEGSMYVSGGGK